MLDKLSKAKGEDVTAQELIADLGDQRCKTNQLRGRPETQMCEAAESQTKTDRDIDPSDQT